MKFCIDSHTKIANFKIFLQVVGFLIAGHKCKVPFEISKWFEDKTKKKKKKTVILQKLLMVHEYIKSSHSHDDT